MTSESSTPQAQRRTVRLPSREGAGCGTGSRRYRRRPGSSRFSRWPVPGSAPWPDTARPARAGGTGPATDRCRKAADASSLACSRTSCSSRARRLGLVRRPACPLPLCSHAPGAHRPTGRPGAPGAPVRPQAVPARRLDVPGRPADVGRRRPPQSAMHCSSNPAVQWISSLAPQRGRALSDLLELCSRNQPDLSIGDMPPPGGAGLGSKG